MGHQQARDVLRLEVTPASPDSGGGYQLQVYVNDVEMTSAGAGMGMDPYDVLVPTNVLVATVEPRTVPIARCVCGVYGCGATDVTITREGDVVRWDWSIEVPINRPVRFAAERYDAEVLRAGEDHTWEIAERTAGRLVLSGMNRDALLAHGLKPSWVANNHRDARLFRVALLLDDDYQVFVDFPWDDRTSEELARDVCGQLERPPRDWRATWLSIRRQVDRPPGIAGPSWAREQY